MFSCRQREADHSAGSDGHTFDEVGSLIFLSLSAVPGKEERKREHPAGCVEAEASSLRRQLGVLCPPVLPQGPQGDTFLLPAEELHFVF